MIVRSVQNQSFKRMTTSEIKNIIANNLFINEIPNQDDTHCGFSDGPRFIGSSTFWSLPFCVQKTMLYKVTK